MILLKVFFPFFFCLQAQENSLPGNNQNNVSHNLENGNRIEVQPVITKPQETKRRINCLNIAGIENFPEIHGCLPRAWSLPEVTVKIR